MNAEVSGYVDLNLKAARDNDYDGFLDEVSHVEIWGFIDDLNAYGYANVKDNGNREESYIQGTLGSGSLYGNAIADSTSGSAYYPIPSIYYGDFWLKAWVDESGNVYANGGI